MVFNRYEEIKDIRRDKNLAGSFELIEQKKKEVVQKKVAPEFEAILAFIDENKAFS